MARDRFQSPISDAVRIAAAFHFHRFFQPDSAVGSKDHNDELTMIYKEYANKQQYKAYFNDITTGDSNCKVGWDVCAGVGSPKTYKGK